MEIMEPNLLKFKDYIDSAVSLFKNKDRLELNTHVTSITLELEKIGKKYGIEFQKSLIQMLLDYGFKFETKKYDFSKDLLYFQLVFRVNGKDAVSLGMGHIPFRKKRDARGLGSMIGRAMIENYMADQNHFITFGSDPRCLIWFSQTYPLIFDHVKEHLTTNIKRELCL